MRAGPVRSEDRCRNQGQPLCRDTDGDYTPPLPVIATGNQSETRLLPPAHPSRNAREMVPSMPVALDFSIPPLEHLTAEERRKLAAAADIAFLQPGEVLIRAGEAPAHLYLIVKGLVSERAGEDVVTVHGAGDLVGASALAAPAPTTVEVRQETIAQLLPRSLLLDLCRANPAFEAWFTQRLGERLAARAEREAARGMAPLMMAKVG